MENKKEKSPKEKGSNKSSKKSENAKEKEMS